MGFLYKELYSITKKREAHRHVKHVNLRPRTCGAIVSVIEKLRPHFHHEADHQLVDLLAVVIAIFFNQLADLCSHNLVWMACVLVKMILVAFTRVTSYFKVFTNACDQVNVLLR